MSNNGFTLMELLGVFIIICFLLFLLFPIVNNVIKRGSSTTYYEQLDKILTAAYDLSLKNLDYLPNSDEKKYISLAELKKEGLIESNLINPKTNKLFEDDLIICISDSKSDFKKNYSKKNGDYIFSINDKGDNSSKNSSIFLDEAIKIGEREYYKKINLNEAFSLNEIKLRDKDNKDITEKSVNNIYNGDMIVSNINTDKLAIYKVIYVVLDNYGNSKKIILNVVVTDEEMPKLDAFEKIKISTEINSYDLLDGVICTDNSDYCNIKFEENIMYGKKGRYVIKYIAKDSFGNTITKKRLVIIE